MGRAEQRLHVLLDPKDAVPGQVAGPAHREDHHTDDRQAVAGRERRQPRPLRLAGPGGGGQDPAGGGDKAGVEQGMPGGEEGFQGLQVVVGPAVHHQADQQPSAQQHGHRVNSPRRPRQAVEGIGWYMRGGCGHGTLPPRGGQHHRQLSMLLANADW
jgi:hypothetical protein